MNVMKILCDSQCEQEVIVAGILHDVVEDTPVTVEQVERKFGKRVAAVVAEAFGEDAPQKGNAWEASWRERKQNTINYLKETENLDKLLVSCADKLDNAHAILQDSATLGETFWSRFNAGKTDQQWYYQSLASTFMKRGQALGHPLQALATKLDETVQQIFKK